MQSVIVRRFVLFFSIFVAALLLAVLACIGGLLSGRAFAVTCIGLSIVGVWILTLLISNAQQSMPMNGSVKTSSPLKGSVSLWLLRVMIGLNVLILGWGIAVTSGAPRLPKITGITVNICLTAGLVAALRRQKRKLGK